MKSRAFRNRIFRIRYTATDHSVDDQRPVYDLVDELVEATCQAIRNAELEKSTADG